MLREYNDFRNDIEVKLYYGKEKFKAVNIIKNSDMLQYHYFSQDYKMVKSASIISILSIKHNNIKYNIGFMSFSYSDINKGFRNMYFEKNFLLNFNKFSKTINKEISFMTISRFVIMPYFRNLNLSKIFQELTIKKIFEIDKYKHIGVIEIYSNLLYNFNFLCKDFESILIDNALNYKDDFKNTIKKYQLNTYAVNDTSKNSSYRVKLGDKLLSLGAFVIKDAFQDLFINYYKQKYNVDIDFNINNHITKERFFNSIENYINKEDDKSIFILQKEKISAN